MGAEGFTTFAKGRTAKEAFEKAVTEAQYEYGHGGYTGTIAEKEHSFKMFPAPGGMDTPMDRIQELRGRIDEEFNSEKGRKLRREALAKIESRTHDKFLDEAYRLINDHAVEKWGPAGAMKVRDGLYLFFGWASS